MKPLVFTKSTSKANHADRGKTTEEQFKKHLEKRDLFVYRPPDARSGSFVRAPADFLAWGLDQSFAFELKEVKKGLRLPAGNVAPHQVQTLKRLADLGVLSFFVVHVTDTDSWYFINALNFEHKSSGSYDLSSWNQTTLENFLCQTV